MFAVIFGRPNCLKTPKKQKEEKNNSDTVTGRIMDYVSLFWPWGFLLNSTIWYKSLSVVLSFVNLVFNVYYGMYKLCLWLNHSIYLSCHYAWV